MRSGSHDSESRATVSERRLVVILLGLHAVLVAVCAGRYSFSWTEGGLLAAGIIDWNYGNFDVFRVSPPLVRMWGTWPLVAAGVEAPFLGRVNAVRSRAEWPAASAFVQAHGEASLVYLTVARLTCLPFTLLGGWIAYRWSRQMFGPRAGLGCLLLWSFMPQLVGYGSLISGDAQAAAMGLATFYFFRQWLRSPSWSAAYLLGVVCGMTVLTKLSWLILFGLLPLLWLLVRAVEWLGRRVSSHSNDSSRDHGPGEPAESQSESRPEEWPAGGLATWRGFGREAASLGFALGVSLFVVNLMYGFEGSLRPLESYQFISRALATEPQREWDSHLYHGNRFAGTWLGKLPVPFPDDLVMGVDLQKWDFDRERWSYLRGQWQTEGWWYYYLYGLAIKVPLGAWLLGVVALVGAIWSWGWRAAGGVGRGVAVSLSSATRRVAATGGWRADWRDELLLLFPLVLVLGMASAETGLNRHLRYVLPIFPPAIVLASRAFLVFESSYRLPRWTVTLASVGFIVSSLTIYPHSISYFNELICGPRNAIAHMNASNLDWGQDVRFLRDWCLKHPEARPLYMKYYVNYVSPEKLGVPTQGQVPGVDPQNPPAEPLPEGWYAIDQESLLGREGNPSSYSYLKQLEPVARVGYSFLIYHIDERLARELVQQPRQVDDFTAGPGERTPAIQQREREDDANPD